MLSRPVSCLQYTQVNEELEEQKELAATRLVELEKLQREHEEAIKEKEQLRMDVSLCSTNITFMYM